MDVNAYFLRMCRGPEYADCRKRRTSLVQRGRLKGKRGAVRV